MRANAAARRASRSGGIAGGARHAHARPHAPASRRAGSAEGGPAAAYQLIAGLAGEAPLITRSADYPFRQEFRLLDDPFTVRMESWLPSDTFRRAGFGHVIRGHEHVLILERGVNLVSFDRNAQPSAPLYAASLYAPGERYRISSVSPSLARGSPDAGLQSPVLSGRGPQTEDRRPKECCYRRLSDPIDLDSTIPARGDGVRGGISAGMSAQTRPAPEALAKSLQQRYRGIKDFSADFVHNYRGGVLKTQTQERGKVTVKKPSRMHWTYTAPERRSSCRTA